MAQAASVPITILHTNDLHSHFRPDKGPLGLGGVARIKTAVEKVRREIPNTLLVDGGDWSEGDIYYQLGTGVETIRMMDHLGYDVAVVGNHDWLNGPDRLLDSVRAASPRMKMVAANIAFNQFDRSREFVERMPPFVIVERDGVKIAFVGLLTFEYIYDKYFSPLQITNPAQTLKQIVSALRGQVDAIVAISHNSVSMNRTLLKEIPELDLVIGAHDHKKLARPEVESGRWVVETGCWGWHLGRVDMKVTPRAEAIRLGKPTVELVRYGLTQMDSTVPEDAETLDRLETLEATLEDLHDVPIFHDHIAESEIEIPHGGHESLMGDFVTDAYIAETQADFALDQFAFIYSTLHRGPIHSVDVYNALPGIYDPATGKSWMLQTFDITGKTLRAFLNILFSSKSAAQLGPISTSGMEVIYEPMVAGGGPQELAFDASIGLDAGLLSSEPEPKAISEVFIRGKPLDFRSRYRVAAGGGVIETIRQINDLLPNAIPLDTLKTTGQEDWRVVARYAQKLSPITKHKIATGSRIRSRQADLGFLYNDFEWTPIRKTAQGMEARVRVTLHNFGATVAPGSFGKVKLLGNLNRANTAVEPAWIEIGTAQAIDAIHPKESRTYVWQGVIPGERGIYPVTAVVEGRWTQTNTSNDSLTHYFVEK